MKIDFQLQIKGIRGLKGLFASLLKIIFSSKEKNDLYMIYFLASSQVRFLINSEECMAIIGLDSKIILNNKSILKQGLEILAIEFKKGSEMIQNFCDLIDKDTQGDLRITLSRQTTQNGQPFRSLNLTSLNTKYRVQIFKPLYDPPVILNHPWLNGCTNLQQKKVQFDVDVQNILNLMRIIVRNKEICSKQRLIRLHFQFNIGKVMVTLEKHKHYSTSTIQYCEFRLPKYQGSYTFVVYPQNAFKVCELFQAKSSGSKLHIDTENRFIFSYYHEGVYESQLLAEKWIIFEEFEAYQSHQGHKTFEAKIQF